LCDLFRVPAADRWNRYGCKALSVASSQCKTEVRSVDLDHGVNYEAWSMPGWILLTVVILSVALLLASLFGADACGAVC
jgi:hypothetical protein